MFKRILLIIIVALVVAQASAGCKKHKEGSSDPRQIELNDFFRPSIGTFKKVNTAINDVFDNILGGKLTKKFFKGAKSIFDGKIPGSSKRDNTADGGHSSSGLKNHRPTRIPLLNNLVSTVDTTLEKLVSGIKTINPLKIGGKLFKKGDQKKPLENQSEPKKPGHPWRSKVKHLMHPHPKAKHFWHSKVNPPLPPKDESSSQPKVGRLDDTPQHDASEINYGPYSSPNNINSPSPFEGTPNSGTIKQTPGSRGPLDLARLSSDFEDLSDSSVLNSGILLDTERPDTGIIQDLPPDVGGPNFDIFQGLPNYDNVGLPPDVGGPNFDIFQGLPTYDNVGLPDMGGLNIGFSLK